MLSFGLCKIKNGNSASAKPPPSVLYRYTFTTPAPTLNSSLTNQSINSLFNSSVPNLTKLVPDDNENIFFPILNNSIKTSLVALFKTYSMELNFIPELKRTKSASSSGSSALIIRSILLSIISERVEFVIVDISFSLNSILLSFA